MKVGLRLLVLLLVAAICACSPPPREASAAVASAKATVVLLRESGDEASAFAPPRAAAYELRVLPEGKLPVANRLATLFGEVAAEEGVTGVVVQPSQAGTAEALARVRQANRDITWIVAESRDDPISLEAAADLVVDFGSASPVDALREAALARGLCELARRVATGKAKIDDRAEIRAALRSAGGFDWKVDYRVDSATGIKAKNHIIVMATARK